MTRSQGPSGSGSSIRAAGRRRRSRERGRPCRGWRRGRSTQASGWASISRRRRLPRRPSQLEDALGRERDRRDRLLLQLVVARDLASGSAPGRPLVSSRIDPSRNLVGRRKPCRAEERHARTTIIDLARLSLSHGEGKRLDLPVELEPLRARAARPTCATRSPTVRARRLPAQRRLRLPPPLPAAHRGAVHALPRAGAARARGRAREVDQARAPTTRSCAAPTSTTTSSTRPLGPRRRHPRPPHPDPLPPDCAGLCPDLRRVPQRRRPHEHEDSNRPRWAA